MDRVSVPLWLIFLSEQLPVIGLVGHYLTNYLMGRGPLSKRLAPLRAEMNQRAYAVLANLSVCCSHFEVGHHVLLTRLPLTL